MRQRLTTDELDDFTVRDSDRDVTAVSRPDARGSRDATADAHVDVDGPDGGVLTTDTEEQTMTTSERRAHAVSDAELDRLLHAPLVPQLRQIVDDRDHARAEVQRLQATVQRLTTHVATTHARMADSQLHADNLRQRIRRLATDHGLATSGTLAAITARIDAALAERRTEHLALLPAGHYLGDILHTDEHPRHMVAATTPRTLPLSAALADGHSSRRLCDWVRGDAPQLALLSPAEHGELEQPPRWRITGWCPLHTVLGPHGAVVLELARTWAVVLDDNDTAGTADTYAAAVTRCGTDELLHAASAAEAALRAVGADCEFWTGCMPSGLGWEITAVAARDLLGTVPGWDTDAYALLTGPFRHVIGLAHPDDHDLHHSHP